MAIATVIGIGTGVAIFQPAIKEEMEQKGQEKYASCPYSDLHANDVIAASNSRSITRRPRKSRCGRRRRQWLLREVLLPYRKIHLGSRRFRQGSVSRQSE